MNKDSRIMKILIAILLLLNIASPLRVFADDDTNTDGQTVEVIDLIRLELVAVGEILHLGHNAQLAVVLPIAFGLNDGEILRECT